MQNYSKKFWLGSLIAAILGGAICYLTVAGYFLLENKTLLENELELVSARSTAAAKFFSAKITTLKDQKETLIGQVNDLNNTINQIEEDLTATESERDNFEKKYKREKNRMDELDSQISDIQDTAETLQKLEATDDELLMKYSKIYFLNENYAPESLEQIDSQYAYNPNENYLFYADILPFLEDMLKDAQDDDINLKIVSAYRSFTKQSNLKTSYTMIYGTGANQFSADQGYSEHQLGTTVDLTTAESGAGFANFDQSNAYKWLVKNAYKYGFILSYPQNNAYYMYEPWHWRFVGRDLAEYLHEKKISFYNLDQRVIDGYQISFFD